jgi:hypothetical protein
MIEDENVDANSTIRRLEAVEAMYPLMERIHVLLGSARCHRAVLGLESLGRRIGLRFIPSCRPPLNPIERLWRLMPKRLTHNKSWPDYPTFAKGVPHILSEDISKQRDLFRNSLTDNFRVIDLNDFGFMA